jgi:hypothetical protein
MKFILIHASTFETNWAHYSFIKDPVFVNKLSSLGYQLCLSTDTEPEKVDWIIFSEATSIGIHRFGFFNRFKYYINLLFGRTVRLKNDVYEKCIKNGLLHKTVLLVMEGPVGMPANHIPYVKNLCPKIVTWNDSIVDGKNVRKYNWPVPDKWPSFSQIPFNKKKLFVNISANKYSSHKLELYSNRRNLIKFLEKEYPNDFDLYGIGWNEPATFRQRQKIDPVPFYRSYLGSVDDKAVTFRNYKFALCFENSCVPGWITEKIFDCMRSNCVPIYLGAPNILDFVDANVFIDIRKFSSNKELFDYLASMSEKEYNRYLIAINSYLESCRFHKFYTTSFAERIVEILETEED